MKRFNWKWWLLFYLSIPLWLPPIVAGLLAFSWCITYERWGLAAISLLATAGIGYLAGVATASLHTFLLNKYKEEKYEKKDEG